MTNKPTIKDSLLLCASDLQHSAIYDNHGEMQRCLRAVADRITALASVIEGVERAALAVPAQAGEYQPSSADMVMAALDTEEWGLERMQRWHCLTDEGHREGAWLVKRQKAPYCAVYTDKPGEPYGPRSWSGPTALDALQKAADDLGICLPQPAARGAALAALKHPAVKPNMLVNGGALKLALNVLRRAGKNEVADELECTAQAAPVDADVRLERERLCEAIKAEDDYCVEHGDYMLDSDDCIKIVRGEWQRPDFAITALAAKKETND